MASYKRMQLSVLTMNTLSFTVCFAVWVMFSIIGIPIKTGLQLNDTQFGLLAATPILTGSLIRLPLGMWTDTYGGRIVFALLMLSTILPIWLISTATEYWHFLVLGLFVGVAGGAFSVGIAYTGRWFSRERKGFAMGIFGAGNAGAAVTKFVAPTLVVTYGWQAVPKVYAVAMAVTVVLFWLFTYSDPDHRVGEHVTMRDQLVALKDIRVWKYCQYYSIVFGGYVALSLWMTKYYISEYGFGIQTAALIAAIFVLPSGVIRALGGWLSDKFGAHTVTWWVMWASCICPVSALLSPAPGHHQDHPWRDDSQSGPQCLGLHRAALRGRHRLGLRQGLGLQVHRRRIPPQHRRHLRDRRPDRRPGRVSLPDHLRHAGRFHRDQQYHFHAAVRGDLLVADLDVHHRGPRGEDPATDLLHRPGGRGCRGSSSAQGHPALRQSGDAAEIEAMTFLSI